MAYLCTVEVVSFHTHERHVVIEQINLSLPFLVAELQHAKVDKTA